MNLRRVTKEEGNGARRWPFVVMALASYGPLLFTSPGKLSADTKSYLYLNPGELLRSATSMWDPGIALGYVPHQNIGYLWPMGPWFWALDAVGLPDWLAQRLWWGSLFFAAGAGVIALGRHLRWNDRAAVAAAFVYACSPYTLVFLARISGILIPWAALPWLLLLAVRSVRAQGWRYPAAFALIAATAGSTNLTALVLIGLGPLVWLVHLAVANRRALLRDVLRAAGRMGVLTMGASAWWITGLAVQATHGTDVLRYSETAEVVTSSSSGSEVLRGLGNWFFYGRDRLGPWIESSEAYTQRIPLLVATMVLPAVALFLGVVVRWRHRAASLSLVVFGLFVSVGAYPWDDPPPLGRVIRAVLLDERGFAFRALSRATPLLVLGLALLVGAGLTVLSRRWPRRAGAMSLAVLVLAVAGIPPLWQRQLVPDNLRREEDVPEYWREAAARLDAPDDDTRVLELPGSDFAAYRWGNTVDPITPGLIDRPVAYRELIPFGPPESAALLAALDLGLQERTLPSAALAPIARLLRVGDILVRSDLEFERYNTPRPKELIELVQRAAGLGPLEGFGPGAPNRPDPVASLDDEIFLLRDHLSADPPEVSVLPVVEPVPIVAAQPVVEPVIVAGDAFGVVDLASAGLIDGRELLRFSAGLSDADLAQALADGGLVVITDTNRKRAQRWQSVRFTQGFTEPAGEGLLRRDLTDNRLPFFDELGSDPQTVSVQTGAISATASTIGNQYVLSPQDRPAAAIDGDARTAWRTAGLGDPSGEFLRLRLDVPGAVDRIRLLQSFTKQPDRWISSVRLRFDDGTSATVSLDRSSRAAPGQLVRFRSRTVSSVEVEILGTTAAPTAVDGGTSAVGFAEVGLGTAEPKVDEWVRTPVDLIGRESSAVAAAPMAVVVTRRRADPADFLRDDEERRIARIVTLPRAGEFSVGGSVRLSARANDAAIESVLARGGPVVVGAESRLLGSRWTGGATLDGDPSTWWISPRSGPTGAAVRFSAARRITVDHLDLQVVADERFSVPTQLDISVDGESPVVVRVPAIERQPAPGTVVTVRGVLPRPLSGQHFVVRVTDADVVRVTDWNSGDPIAQPVAIAELGVPGVSVPRLPDRIDTGCRTDLVDLDGAPMSVRVTGSMDDALAGRPLQLTGCGAPPALEAGEHRIRTALGIDGGLDVDQLVLHTPDALVDTTGLLRSARTTSATVTVTDETPTRVAAEILGSPGEEVWLVLGQSFEDGWAAAGRAGEGSTLGGPTLVDGFANGWRVRLDGEGRAAIVLQYLPQGPVRAGLVTSGLTALVCLGLLLLGRRGDPGPEPIAIAWPRPGARVRHPDQPSRAQVARGALLVGGATFAVSVLVVAPGVAAVVALAGAIGYQWRPVAVLVRLAPAVLVLVAGSLVVARQVNESTPTDGAWADVHRRSHSLVEVAVLAVVIDEVLDRRWSRTEGRPRRRMPLRAQE